MTKITKDCYVDVSGWTEEEVKQAAEMFKEAVGDVRIGDIRVLRSCYFLFYDKECDSVWVGDIYDVKHLEYTAELTKSDFFPDSLAQNTPKNDDNNDLIQTLKVADKTLLEAQKAYEKALDDVRQALGDDWVVERKENGQLVCYMDFEDGVVEDMSNPSNWKPGDLIECLKSCSGEFTGGELYTYSGKSEYGSCGVVKDDKGSNTNGWLYENFKWHSRPNN